MKHSHLYRYSDESLRTRDVLKSVSSSHESGIPLIDLRVIAHSSDDLTRKFLSLLSPKSESF